MNISKVEEKLNNLNFCSFFKDELQISEIVKDTFTYYEIIIL